MGNIFRLQTEPPPSKQKWWKFCESVYGGMVRWRGVVPGCRRIAFVCFSQIAKHKHPFFDRAPLLPLPTSCQRKVRRKLARTCLLLNLSPQSLNARAAPRPASIAGGCMCNASAARLKNVVCCRSVGSGLAQNIDIFWYPCSNRSPLSHRLWYPSQQILKF